MKSFSREEASPEELITGFEKKKQSSLYFVGTRWVCLWDFSLVVIRIGEESLFTGDRKWDVKKMASSCIGEV